MIDEQQTQRERTAEAIEGLMDLIASGEDRLVTAHGVVIERLTPEQQAWHDAIGQRDDFDMFETVFGDFGPWITELGWSCFPQDSLTRRPCKVDKRVLKWAAYQDRLPTKAEMRSWSLQCPLDNVAIITGAASSYLFALDVDVNDAELSRAVQDLATRFLGETPFLRIGRAPRAVLLYRHLPDVNMRKRTYKFGEHREDGTWGASEHAIEFLAGGSPFTAFGRHHKTGGRFLWPKSTPRLRPPTDTPLVTPEQIEAFLAAVQEIRRFASSRTVRAGADGGEEHEGLPEGYEITPHGNVPVALSGPWVVEDGHVVDGRELYLFKLVGRIVSTNPEVFDDVDLGDEAAHAKRDLDRRMLRSWAVTHVDRTVREDHRRSRQALFQELGTKFKAAIEAFNTWVDAPPPAKGKVRKLPARPTYKGTDGRRYTHGTLSRRYERDAALSWLGERKVVAVDAVVPDDDKAPRVRTFGSTPATDEAREARRLGGDRSAVHRRVRVGNRVSERRFFRDWSAMPFPAEEGEASAPMPPWRVVLNLGPTGAGKTTSFFRRLALNVGWEKARGLPYRGPTVVLQPNHANLRESVITATGAGMRFHDLAADPLAPTDEADATEDYAEMGLAELVEEAKKLGLNAVHLKSKVMAGCRMEDKLLALQAAGLSSSGMCRAERLDQWGNPVRGEDGRPIVDTCPHYEGDDMCGFRKMIAALATADLVLAAHAHLTGHLPSALKRIRGLVIDESVSHQLLATAQIPAATLRCDRPWPELTSGEAKALREKKKARTDGDTRVDDADRSGVIQPIVQDRLDLADILDAAHRDRIHPALAVADAPRGLAMIDSAKRVTASAMASGRRVHPRLTLKGVREVIDKAKCQGAELEHRFLTVLGEAVFRVLHDRKEGGTGTPGGDDPLPCDTRLQRRVERVGKEAVPTWRVSWRRAPNWLGAPTLMLDATGNEVVAAKLFPSATVVAHRPENVDPNLRVVLIADRTYSPSSLYPPADAAIAKRKASEKIVSEVRQLSGMVAGVHGDGQVLWVAPLRTRRRYWTQSTPLGNLMPAHLGALRGQDWAKSYWASICVGRSEQPIWVIDGLVAALTWDTAPEHPFDRRGDGLTDKGAPLYRPRMPRRVRVRDGSDEMLSVPMMPTDMGRRVEAMWREAELTQMIGRLRGIYRDVPGTVILCCDCPPEDLLVDDIITMAEALGEHSKAWDVLGEARGVMLPQVTCRVTPITIPEVEAFVARYRPWHAMREIAWTDDLGVTHEGLVPVWVRDVAATLREIGAPQRVLDTLVVRPARTCPLTWTAREVDHVTVAVEAAWGPNRETHYEVFKVSHPLEEGETEHGRIRRFGATYDPADYATVESCDPEDAPSTAPEAAHMTREPTKC